MNPEALEVLRRSDRAMARLIQRAGPCTLKPQVRLQPYQALVRSVTHQQLNGTAARTIFGRLLALFPGRSFPRPEDLLAAPDEKLRSAGLSRAKTVAIKDIAQKTLDGVVPSRRQATRLSDAEIIERLTVIRGVGPWTVEMFLLFTLGRPDVWPVTDFGVRNGFALTYGLKALPHPKDLLKHGERWRPFRSTAAWYLWRAVDLQK
jgi:DNA-3-methyladenine glycosylase II